jgi:hypothetical protein
VTRLVLRTGTITRPNTPIPRSITYVTLHNRNIRQRALTLISSHAVNATAAFQWFITTVQSDRYDPLIYDNLVTTAAAGTAIGLTAADTDNYHPSLRKAGLNEQRRAKSSQLTPFERQQLINTHPWLAARIFHLHEGLYFDLILNGEDLPLGAKILDWIKRTEFQGRGTTHQHALYALELSAAGVLTYDPKDP